MNQIPDISKFVLFAILVFPGFISMKTYRLIFGGNPVDAKSALIEACFYSALNLCVSTPIMIVFYEPNMANQSPIRFVILLYLVLLVIPISTPMIWAKFARTKAFGSTYQLPFTTAWDYFFDKRNVVWVKVTLTDGSILGGIFGFDSYATCAPNDGEVYLEKCFDIDEAGNWNEKAMTKGIILKKNDYKLMEFFNTESDPQPTNQTEETNEPRT